ncbi:IclR family transcriptional regulator [Paeniglutamicibacter cryotolerans]|uniref:Glycerol operon regulatory protein n=1 Tax=Paeniglutamicibacter cryotolerans TaxID=670079 RepID=A0A839QF86_9MICC|nr:IclR family transcriptional regulator [Paeniglutamicibacter cryotolerans]MBB2994570.1 IclR family acetate operon transcriptional repressor [Paeniglutamicibacter cryotolerans]
MSIKQASGVQSVERAFELLELMARAGGEVTLTQLATETPLPLPTIHRLLRTLVGIGYVRQLPSRRYSLGPRLIRLGEVANRQLGALAEPVLREMVEQLGESANMAVLDGDMVTYISQVPSPHSMRMFTEVGRRANLHDTGVGKAILSVLADERVRRLVGEAGMPTPTPNTIATLPDLFTELERIRDVGYAVDEEEQEPGVRCFAMAVPGAPTPMALSISGPTTRVDAAFADRAIPALILATSKIASALVAVEN